MLKKIKEVALSLGVFSLLAVPLLVPAIAFAAPNAGFDSNTIIDSSCNGTNGNAGGSGIGNCNEANGQTGLNDILRKVIQIFSFIVGFVAVVMIIIGGIKYITSGGDSGNISGAKNTIIYAVIGLIIVALAQILVHFVLKNISNASSTGV